MADNIWLEISQKAQQISVLLTEEQPQEQEKEISEKPEPKPPFFKAFQQGLLTEQEHTLLIDYCERVGKKVYWTWEYSKLAWGHDYLKVTAAYPEPTSEEEGLLIFLAQQEDPEAQKILTQFLLRCVIQEAGYFAYANSLPRGLQEENFEEFIGLGAEVVAKIVLGNIKGFLRLSSLTTYTISGIRRAIIGYMRQQARRRELLSEEKNQEKLFKLGTMNPEQLEEILFKGEEVTSEEPVYTMDDEIIALMEFEDLLIWAIAAYLTLGRRDGQRQKNNAIVLRLLGWTYFDIQKAVGDSSWSDSEGYEGARNCMRRAVDQGGLGDMPPADEIHELLSQHRFESGQLEETLAGLLQGTDLDACVASLSLPS